MCRVRMLSLADSHEIRSHLCREVRRVGRMEELDMLGWHRELLLHGPRDLLVVDKPFDVLRCPEGPQARLDEVDHVQR